MISLDLHPFCDMCDAFKPEVTTIQAHNINGETPDVAKYIRCENHRICAAISRYIEKRKAGDTSETIV